VHLSGIRLGTYEACCCFLTAESNLDTRLCSHSLRCNLFHLLSFRLLSLLLNSTRLLSLLLNSTRLLALR